jgi:hypothetical protein
MNTQTLLTDLTSEQEELVSGGGLLSRFLKYLPLVLEQAGRGIIANRFLGAFFF